MKVVISPDIQKEELEYCRSRLMVYGILFSTEEVLGKCREGNLNGVRALIIVMLRAKGYSYTKIGAILNRDHATALHHLKNYEKKWSGRMKDYGKIKNSLLNNTSKEEIMLQINIYFKEIERLNKILIKSEQKG